VCDARKKLDEEVFRSINRKIIQHYPSFHDEDTQWMGHRIFAVDGSKINLPRALLDDGYKLPSETSGYPQGLLSCLYQLKTKIPFDFDLSLSANERVAAERHLSQLEKNDVVVYDSGYLSYYMLHLHAMCGVHAVFRLPEASFCEVKTFFESQETDSIVTISASKNIRCDIRKENKNFEFSQFQLRLVKYTYNQTTYCVGTTLLDARYTITDLGNLYFARWGVEELYKISKCMFHIEDFHAKTERGVKQELYAHFALITMNRIYANHADNQLNKPDSLVPLKGQIFQTNFANCVHVFARCFEGLLMFHEAVKEKIQHAFKLIAGQFSKVRNGRSYPRKSMKPSTKWTPRNQTIKARRMAAATAA
jgi:hypothetical protein